MLLLLYMLLYSIKLLSSLLLLLFFLFIFLFNRIQDDTFFYIMLVLYLLKVLSIISQSNNLDGKKKFFSSFFLENVRYNFLIFFSLLCTISIALPGIIELIFLLSLIWICILTIPTMTIDFIKVDFYYRFSSSYRKYINGINHQLTYNIIPWEINK